MEYKERKKERKDSLFFTFLEIFLKRKVGFHWEILFTFLILFILTYQDMSFFPELKVSLF